MKKISYALCFLTIILSSCRYSPTNTEKTEDSFKSDSLEITHLVTETYRWYCNNVSQLDFDVIEKDSFQVGIDSIKLLGIIDKLKESDYFSKNFIDNYEKLGLAADSIMRSGKYYYNEINFNFQSADIWTHSQDFDLKIWEKLKFTDLNIKGDEASIKWHTEEYKDKSVVKLKKDNGKWKISYLDGIDERALSN